MKLILFALLSLLMIGIYLLSFSPSQRKAARTFEKIPLIKIGMSSAKVISILSKPDTIYPWQGNNDSVLVLDYNMGFGAPDGLRVILKHDSVAAIQYAQ